MNNGFFRVAAAAPLVKVADPATNADRIIELINKAYDTCADAVVFPEMCVTGYTCGDLFHNRALIDASAAAIARIAGATAGADGILAIVGAPEEADGTIYNTAYAICGGHIVATVRKTYVPNYNEFYERRWWQPATTAPTAPTIICHRGVEIGIEICEDLWVPVPPSSYAALAGAKVLFNLSASPDQIGKYAYLNSLVSQQSARCISAYVYASAGYGESSTDLAFDAKLLIAQNGTILARNKRWQHTPQLVVSDIDIEALSRDRLHQGTFYNCRTNSSLTPVIVHTGADESTRERELIYKVDPHPFVPAVDSMLKERCEEIISIQVTGLCQRLQATGCRCLTIGISGGLDSTLALLVAVRAFDALGLDRKGIVGVTMPGFGTTGRTHGNAVELMEALGISLREISIVKAVEGHFADIDHDAAVQDVTYENCQARERTQILMDLANELGGMVLGTGDLSELALGWATYNGDHMSMYGVNAGVPKTLVRHLTRYIADDTDDEAIRRPLLDIIDTPISPELIPAAADGTIKQKTEDLVGPYELHDFFLYYTLRYGFSPRRIYLLATRAFGDTYPADTIKHWLRTFFRRFFAQQFKRSCMPDGPKVGSVCLSPRGDWRMPSDASSAIWLAEVDSL